MKTLPAIAVYFKFDAIGMAALARDNRPGAEYALAHGFKSLVAMQDALQAETRRLLADIRQDLETKS